MAEGNGAIYNNFKEQVMEGIFDLSTGGDTIQVSLHVAYTPNIDTHTVWADVSATEESGTGYSANGEVLGSQDTTQDDANDRGVFDGADVTWTALDIGTPSHCIMWDNTTTVPADALIAYWELGTTATNGSDYTLSWHSDGIILLT